jgi:heme-degrading monooxygenase HmoA
VTVLEHARLHIRRGLQERFEEAFRQARPFIEIAPGFRGLTLSRCLEQPDVYLLLVRWDSVEDHEVGFRGSPGYQQWRARLHHFYDPFPEVEHFSVVASS